MSPLFGPAQFPTMFGVVVATKGKQEFTTYTYSCTEAGQAVSTLNGVCRVAMLHRRRPLVRLTADACARRRQAVFNKFAADVVRQRSVSQASTGSAGSEFGAMQPSQQRRVSTGSAGTPAAAPIAQVGEGMLRRRAHAPVGGG